MTIGLIPHDGEYPFYTNTHDHAFQVIVKNELGEENMITDVGYFDGTLAYHKIGQVTDPNSAIDYATRYLASKGTINATIVLQTRGML